MLQIAVFQLLLVAGSFASDEPAHRGQIPANSILRVGAAAVELHVNDEWVKAAENIFGVKWAGTEQEGLLRAVATVVQGPPDDTRVAIVALDIGSIGRHSLDAAAQEIEEKTGISFDHVLINCTHNHHAGAATTSVHGVRAVPEFLEQIKRAIVQAVVQADQRLKNSAPVTVLFKMGREETVGENSRWERSDGTITWWGTFDAAIRPTGPFDADFPVLAFKRPDRSLAAVLFGHSTHTVGTRNPERRSPAFYGLAAQAFERETGAITTFLEGASGSTHVWRLDGLPYPQVATDAERRVLNALRYTVDQAGPTPVGRIASIRREVTVTVRNFDEQKEERVVSDYCAKHCQDAPAGAERVVAGFRQMRAELAPYRGQARKTWISAMRIGDVAIVGVSAELFTQLGIDIKNRSPFRHTIIAELAHDYIGYVGNADAYRLGGYQLWMGHHSWTECGTGELLVDVAVKLLNELYAQ